MKQEKKGGIVAGLISGVGGLILITVIVLIIISTLLGANLLGANSSLTVTTTNESSAWINATSYQLGTSNSTLSGYAISGVTNASDEITILAGNYTVDTATGIVTNATAEVWVDVQINWTATHTFDNRYKSTTDSMGANLTQGIDNISSKIPTILLLGAIVLLLGVIVLLINQSRKMGFGSGNASL